MIAKTGIEKVLIARAAKQINITEGFWMEWERGPDRENRQRFELLFSHLPPNQTK